MQQADEQLSNNRFLLSWAFDFACIRPGNSHSRGILPLLAIPHAPPRLLRPLDALGFGASQVQCCTSVKDGSLESRSAVGNK